MGLSDGNVREDYNRRIHQAIEMLNFDEPDEALDLVNGIISDLSQYGPDEIKQNGLSWEAINAYNLKGSILNRKDDIDGAEECFDEVLNSYDDVDSCANMNKGIIAKKRKNYSQALEYYDKALVNAPQEIADVVAGAKNEVYMMMGEDSDCLDALSPKAKELIEKGNEFRENQNYWDAFDCYEEAGNEDSSCDGIVCGLIEETKKEFSKVFQIGPVDNGDDEAAQLKRAAIHYVFNEYAPLYAFTLNEKALHDHDENDSFALNSKGIIYFYMDELDKAVEAFDKCLEVDGDYLYANFNKAIVLKRMGRIEEAEESFGEIMKMPSRFQDPSEDLLRLYRLTVVFNSMFYIDLL